MNYRGKRSKILFGVAIAPLLGAAAAESVPSKICAECHAGIYRTYSSTPMAASSGRAATGLLVPKFENGSFTDRGGEYRYSAGRDSRGYFFEFEKRNTIGSTRRALPYFVGSGTTATAFLISSGGFLYESPVTYYRRSEAWDLSPGYEKYSYPFMTRAIAPGCLLCHASGLRRINGTQNGYASPPFQEGGVSCERCHGPGENHVGRMRSGDRTGTDIVNPARLDPERRDSICAQCHLSGEVRVQRPGKENQAFVAGEKLKDYTTTFVRGGDSTRLKVTSHVENLGQSGCKRASGDRLWCGSCHDPHFVPVAAQKAAWFRSKCLACHTEPDCTGPKSARLREEDNCAACHMPRSPAVDAEHVVYTDHSIPKRPRAGQLANPSSDAPLEPWGQTTADVRDLALAYAIVALREDDAAYRARAFEQLQKAVNLYPDDPQTLSYSADLYRKRSDDGNAIRLYERLIQLDQDDLSAPVALGAYAMERGNYAKAIELWNRALRKNPALVLVRVNLAVALLRTGRSAEAREAVERALEFNPEFPAARDLLSKIGR